MNRIILATNIRHWPKGYWWHFCGPEPSYCRHWPLCFLAMLHHGRNSVINVSIILHMYIIPYTYHQRESGGGRSGTWSQALTHRQYCLSWGGCCGCPTSTGNSSGVTKYQLNISATTYTRIKVNGNKNDRHPKPKKKLSK